MNAQSSRTLALAGSPDQPVAMQGEPADPDPRQPGGPVLLIDLVEDAGDWSAFGEAAKLEALVKDAADAVARAAPVAARLPSPGRLTEAVVALSSDAAVAILNGQYRGRKKPTNVLSFPAAAQVLSAVGDADPVQLGDIVLASETVLAEAADMGISPANHLRHLIVHGLLHLLGYDHIEAAEAEEMEALETHILATMGVADPYAGSEPADAPS